MSIETAPLDPTRAEPAATAVIGRTEPPNAPADPGVGAAEQASVLVDTLPASPPPELGAQIAAAEKSYERLARSGQHIHFGVDGESGRLTVELHDADGAVLGTLSPTQALEIAGGGGPKQ